MWTDYVYPDTYATAAAALAAAEAAGPTAPRRLLMNADTVENLVLAAVAWTSRYPLRIEGNGAVRVIDGSGGAFGIHFNNRTDLQVVNIDMRNATNVQFYQSGINSLFYNCRASGGNYAFYDIRHTRIVGTEIFNVVFYGVHVANYYDVRVESCDIHDCGQVGIYLGAGQTLFVDSSLLYDNGTAGTIFMQLGARAVIQQSSFLRAKLSDIVMINGDCKATLLNNIFRSPAQYCLDANFNLSPESQSPFLRSNGNCLNGFGTALARVNGVDYATLADWQAYLGDDANSISADPQFVNEGDGTEDLHLQATSPCKNDRLVGVLPGAIGTGVLLDAFGVPFPDQARMAIGADGSQDVGPSAGGGGVPSRLRVGSILGH